MRKQDILDSIPHSKMIIKNSPKILADGGSCIADPNGEWLVEPQVGKEGLTIAEISHKQVRMERQNFDPVGHYSRPDVTKLQINRERQKTIDINDGNS